MHTLLAKLRALFRRKNVEAEMAEEMQQHHSTIGFENQHAVIGDSGFALRMTVAGITDTR